MISVSYLKSKYSKSETLKKIDESICDFLHVDLMDGKYVAERNFTISDVINDLKNVSKPLDIHLMVINPYEYIDELAKLKPDTITIHLDSTENVIDTIFLIKDYDIKVGIAINPDDDITIIDNYINDIDYVLIMSVYPGRGGQEFIPRVLDKIPYLYDKNVLIGIDGGINDKTIHLLKEYNIDRIISGSFVCMSDNYNEKILELKKIL